MPFLFQVDRVPGENLTFDPHEYLRSLRSYMDRRTGRGILLGEVNVPHKEQKQFFGGSDGDELNMQFDFIGMQATYLSLAREDARPLAKALKARPDVDPDNQWAMFLRNHDELTLDKLSDSEREEVFAAFGPDKDMQLFDRGLRRRLPTMLGGDERRLRMAYSLMFSLPGTPVLFYGEEIGMGENLDVEGRLAVRTPMQWTADKDGGFSTASTRSWPRPMPSGPYGATHVNVASQRNDPDSFWSFMKRLIERYRQSPEIGWSQVQILQQPHPSVLAHVCRFGDWVMVGLHNFGSERLEVPIQVDNLAEGSELMNLLTDADRIALSDKGAATIVLDGYGYHWLRVVSPHDRRIA